jgi:hypothetical protein
MAAALRIRRFIIFLPTFRAVLEPIQGQRQPPVTNGAAVPHVPSVPLQSWMIRQQLDTLEVAQTYVLRS